MARPIGSRVAVMELRVGGTRAVAIAATGALVVFGGVSVQGARASVVCRAAGPWLGGRGTGGPGLWSETELASARVRCAGVAWWSCVVGAAGGSTC